MTITPADRCGWSTGTVYTGTRRCGKTSKARTNHPSTDNGRVCGNHIRSVRSRGPVGVTYAVRLDKPVHGGCLKCGGETMAEHTANIEAFGSAHIFVGIPKDAFR
ncbi:hypothetical protein [Polymorphospora lycopeni]|uniref:Uncharacterized protein n=1 Tax=Polymorphospora lycopeni TaxID=3140240 RepID=A0ABV5CKZ5_9ACTN